MSKGSVTTNGLSTSRTFRAARDLWLDDSDIGGLIARFHG
jgi:hypothetical protein